MHGIDRRATGSPLTTLVCVVVLLNLLPPPRTAAVEIGTTITPERVNEVTDILLPGVVETVRRGMRIEVIAPRRVQWRRAYTVASEKYQGQARLGPHGELRDYVAGLPFIPLDPNDPQIATKIIWNYYFGPWIVDDAVAQSFQWETGHISGGSGMRVESGENRDSEQSKWLRTVGRLYVPPLHTFKDNPKNLMQMEIFGPTFPIFLTLMRSGPLLTYRYLSAREDDLWYYTSWDRKVRRIPPQIRYEAFGDVVIDLASAWGFSAPTANYSWRYLGERKLLGVMHARNYPTEWCPEQGDFAPCEVWEERTVYLIEAIPRMPYDSYGKRIIAVDKQAWVILYTDLYDKEQQLWKSWINYWSYRPYAGGGPNSEEHAYILAGSAVDFADEKALRWRLPGTRPLAEAVTINTGLRLDDFSVGALGTALD
jgi:hypothetical protein